MDSCISYLPAVELDGDEKTEGGEGGGGDELDCNSLSVYSYTAKMAAWAGAALAAVIPQPRYRPRAPCV